MNRRLRNIYKSHRAARRNALAWLDNWIKENVA